MSTGSGGDGLSSDSLPLTSQHSKTVFADSGWEVNFEKLDRIDGGGFAEVFRARDKRDGDLVALKISKSGADYVKRLQREISTLRGIDDAHVMPVLESGQDWYAMPLAEGNLATLAPELSAEAITEVIRDAATGLAAMHKKKVYHRDVSPKNILSFLSSSGFRTWVVSDLGLVTKPPGKSSIPKTKGRMGTEGFMAPEMFSIGAHAVDHRADIYSLGRVLALVVTAKTPKDAEPLSAGPPWTDLIDKMTAFSREDRHDSMDDVLADLPELHEKLLKERRRLWELKRETTDETVLSPHEIKVLGWLLQDNASSGNFYARFVFKEAHQSVRLTIRLGLIGLRRRKFLETFTDNENEEGDRLTDEAEVWVTDHADQLDPSPLPLVERPSGAIDPDAAF